MKSIIFLRHVIGGILLILAFSCRKDAPIMGTGILPAQAGLGVRFTDTLTIISNTVREDSLRTDGMGSNVLGSYIDPDFGLVAAGIYTQIRLPSNNIYLGTNPQFDSIVLTLAYNGFYGDPDVPQTISVYEVKERMSSSTPYYSNKDFTIDPTHIGFLSFIPRPKDSITVDGSKLPPHVRIPLSGAFGTKLLSQSGGGAFVDNNAFLEFLKGLYIVPEGAPSVFSPGGGMMYVNMKSPQSKVTLYYRNDQNEPKKLDFLINAECVIVNRYYHNYSGTAVETALNNQDTVNGAQWLYVQSLAGVKAKIKIPYIKNLGKILINKAEIIFTVASDNAQYPAPEQMVCLRSDSVSANALVMDQLEPAYYGGKKTKEMNNGKEVIRYRFNLARHFQRIVNGELEDYGLYLLAFPSSEIADRVIIAGNLHPEYSIQFNLTYTVIE